MRDFQYIQQKYLVQTYPNRQLTFLKGKGVYLYDDKGNKYLDVMSNYGVNIFGYNHPEITKAFAQQLKILTSLHSSFNNDVRAQASEKIVKRCGEGYSQVYWSSSGAEAVEAALKFAVLATGKKKFIACKDGYHGKTLGALSASFGQKYKEPFLPLLWQFTHVGFNNLEELEKTTDKEVAAFIVEPIQGESGIRVPGNDYLKRVRSICDKHNILLILDEIQTGTGRTGEFLASHDVGISGDIVCLGKGLAGGIPVGATVVNQKVAAKIPKASHTSTFGGNPLVCAGVLIILSLLNPATLNYIKTTGEYFRKSLRKIRSDKFRDIRGKGLMIGVEVAKDERNDILKKLQNEKILAIPAGENVVRFLPPYIIEKQHIDLVIKSLNKVLH